MNTNHAGILCVAVLLAGCSTAERGAPGVTGARVYPGLDAYHRPIRTDSPEAQRWFDQGFQLLYGFNHDEAIRSFQEAAVHDPESPMPWWGIAYAYGININRPVMTEEMWAAAHAAAQEAKRRVKGADPVEAALVEAVSARYSWPPPAQQRTLDEAYAAAMRTGSSTASPARGTSCTCRRTSTCASGAMPTPPKPIRRP